MSIIELPFDYKGATLNDLKNLKMHISAALDSIEADLRVRNEPILLLSNPSKRALNILLFDNHFGEKIVNGDSLIYNFEQAHLDVARTFDEAFTIANLYGLDKFDTFNIILGGDHVEGDGTVYGTQIHHIIGSIGTQIQEFVHAVIHNTNRLKNHVGENSIINIYGVPGNHGLGKQSTKQSVHPQHPVKDNFDTHCYRMIDFYIRGRQDAGQWRNVNIEYAKGDDPGLIVDIKNSKTLLLHLMPKNMSTTKGEYYAYVKSVENDVDTIYTGHFHSAAMHTVGKARIFRIGTSVGPNEYSESLGIPRNFPEQAVTVTSSDKPVEAFFPIVLRDE